MIKKIEERITRSNDIYKSDTEIDLGNVKVNLPVADQNKWYVKQESSMTVSKEEWVLIKFKETFHPKFSQINTIEKILDLVSQNNVIKKWYNVISLEFIESLTLPMYFKNILKPVEYNQLQIALEDYNIALRKESEEIKKIADEKDRLIREIKDRTEKTTKEVLSRNPLFKILKMNVGQLPISLAIEALEYTPSDRDESNSKKRYTKEILSRYKAALVELVNNNPSIDIDKIIDENSTK